MAMIETVICDVCGATKGEGNRWLIGWASLHGYALADWPTEPVPITANHFCGEKCALSRQAQYLRREKH